MPSLSNPLTDAHHKIQFYTRQAISEGRLYSAHLNVGGTVIESKPNFNERIYFMAVYHGAT